MRSLFLDVCPGERRGVVVLDGKPERLLIEREGEPDRPRLGDIWAGRVGSSAPGFRGFFVVLDEGPPGLMAAEAGARPSEGAMVEVEVTAEARAGKGPLLRRRGAGAGAVGRVRPAQDMQARLQAFAPESGIVLGPAAREAADVAEEEALAQTHLLSGGLSLCIERTRGLTAVDVDFARAEAGKRAILDANRRAVREAARLLRLKGLGGLSVMDLIGKASEHSEILGAASEAFAPDQPGVVIAGISRLGLLEVARPWGETPVAERLLGDDGAPTIRSVAQRLVRALEREGRVDPGARLVCVCAPEVAAELDPLVRQLGPRFGVAAEAGRGRLESHIQPR